MKRILLVAVAVVLMFSVALAAQYYYTVYIRTLLYLQDGAHLTFAGNNNITVPATDSIAFSGSVFLNPVYLAVDDTVTVPDGFYIVFYGDSTGLLRINGGYDGRYIWLTTNDTTEITLVDGQNLLLSGNANVDSTEVIGLVYKSDVAGWVEVVQHAAN